MREVTIGDHVFRVRPWKRREIKAMKKAGYALGGLNAGNMDEAMDYVFERTFDQETVERIEDLDNRDVLDIWKAWLSENFGGDDVKN